VFHHLDGVSVKISEATPDDGGGQYFKNLEGVKDGHGGSNHMSAKPSKSISPSTKSGLLSKETKHKS
jgi:hypothetical protein